MANDELIDDHVSLQQCGKAIKALHSHQTKRIAERQERELLPGKEENIWLVVAVKKVSPTLRIKPIRIPIAHPIVDPRTTPVCLITKDPQREYKDLLEKHKIKFISRVVGLAKLKGKFRPFEARRMLLKENGLFLADDRVIPLLPKLLGSKWFEAKKQPIPVSLAKKDLKKELERAISSTYMNQNRGTCTSVRIGTLTQNPSQILENLKIALPAIVKHIKDGWENVQTFYVKTNSSVSLPIWTCDLGDGKEGRWNGLTVEVQDEEGSSRGEETAADRSTKTEQQIEESNIKRKKRASEDQGAEEEKPKKKTKKGDNKQPKQKAQSSPPCSASESEPRKNVKKGVAGVSSTGERTTKLEKLKQWKAESSDGFEGSDKVKGVQRTQPLGKATPSVTGAEVRLKRMKDVGEKKKEKVLNSRGNKSVKAAITGKKAARD